MESMLQVRVCTECRLSQLLPGPWVGSYLSSGWWHKQNLQLAKCSVSPATLKVVPVHSPWSLMQLTQSCALPLLLQTLEMELPDTAASIRLSSLELSDCMSELGALGSDVSAGVRSAAQIVTSLEAGAKQGAGLVGSVVVPALARRETRVRGGPVCAEAAGGAGLVVTDVGRRLCVKVDECS